METYTTVQAESEQFVSFMMDSEEYSFPIDSVQEIVRLPEVTTTVPGAPGAVKGIINLRGSILPLIDLRNRLDFDSRGYGTDTRVVVVRHEGNVTGIIVDKVNEVLRVEKHDIEESPSAVDARHAALLRGLARVDGGERVVMILSEEKLLPEAPDQSRELPGQNNYASEPEKEIGLEDEKHLVSFRLGDEDYAVAITEVREIVRVGEIIHVPQSPEFVVGYMSLRTALLPVVDLRARLGIAGAESPEKHPSAAPENTDDEIDPRRIIVVDTGGMVAGLLVDAVSEVLRLPEKDIVQAPEVIDSRRTQYIQEVGRVDEGRRLLLLLSPGSLFSGEEKRAVLASAERYENSTDTPSDSEGKESGLEKQLVCFRIADEEYGMDIMHVREIIRIETVTVVPNAPEHVCGIVNLRGNVLPVIDLRRMFGHDPGQPSAQNRILVIESEGRSTGFVVDAVSEVLRIPQPMIEPAPATLSSSPAGRYVSGIGKLDSARRTIILVDVPRVLELRDEERTAGTGLQMEEPLQEPLHESVAPEAEPPVVNDAGPASPPEAEEKPEGDAPVAERKESELISLVESTVQAAEAPETTTAGNAAEFATELQNLLALKKKELLALAHEAGIRPNSRATKKQIATLLLEKRAESK